ncbi:MAG: pyridoxal phosphate-dependent aminotransferase family protein [Polyangiales bacterium]
MSWIDDKANAELARIREAKEKQVYPFFRPFETGGLHTSIAGKPIVNFSSNDYLGLTDHPKAKEAAKAAVDRYAMGLSSARPQATSVAHVELEERLARFFGFESSLMFTTGYQAMVGAIEALADQDTTLVLDNLSHACILDGTFVAAGTPKRAPEVRFFNHNSARSLERVLKSKERKNVLVLVEGIYSLDGDLGTLPEIVEVCDRYGAVLLVDDAHGSGTQGKRGRGTLEHFGLEGRVPLVMTAFSKVFGAIGGLLLGNGDVLEHIKNSARSFLFSATLPVPVVATVATILTMLEQEGPALVEELHEKVAYMRKGLTDLGFDLGKSNTHIMPPACRDENKALFMHVALLESGVMMIPLVYPAVKRGEERLRLNVTRGHTREDMDRALGLLETYGRAFYVLGDE